jgi:solute carrier family 25 (adenine nucleotide translocator) protein 4/5/6/31
MLVAIVLDLPSSMFRVARCQFNGLLNIYRKTLATNGIVGLYQGFVIFCANIVVYWGLYFGIYDFLKLVILVGSLEVFYMSFNA